MHTPLGHASNGAWGKGELGRGRAYTRERERERERGSEGRRREGIEGEGEGGTQGGTAFTCARGYH